MDELIKVQAILVLREEHIQKLVDLLVVSLLPRHMLSPREILLGETVPMALIEGNRYIS